MDLSDDIPKCRMRIRSPRDDYWYDVCKNPTFVRDAANENWIPLQVGASLLQDPDFEKEWMVLSCEFDPEFDNPCEDPRLPDGDCVGQPNDEAAGSGDGKGSGGLQYNEQTGYPAGFDLPDAGVSGFALIEADQSITGYYLYRPVLGVPHTYQYGTAGSTGRGTWRSPLKLNDGIYIANAKITETIYDITGITGCVPITFSSINDCCIAVDVYVDGKRVASTCGQACSAGRITACLESHRSNKMMIRVTKAIDELDCGSEVVVGPEVDPDKTDPDMVVPPDGGSGSGNGGTIGGGDVTEGSGDGDGNGGGGSSGGSGEGGGGSGEGLPDPGNPLFPAPCSASIRPKWADRRDNVLTYTVYMGNKSGVATICFDTLVGDMVVEVLYEGLIIQSSKSGYTNGCIEFAYNYNRSENVMVRITTSDVIPNSWELAIYCVHTPPIGGGGDEPDKEGDGDGSVMYPYYCNWSVMSKGAAIHKHWWDMRYDQHDNLDRAMVVVECNPYGDENIVFSAYNQNGTLIGSYSGQQAGALLLPRIVSEHGNSRDRFYIYVESKVAAYWEYHVNCPVPLIDIVVDGELIPWTPSASRPS